MTSSRLIAPLLVCAAATAACHPARFGEGRNWNDKPTQVTARLDCPERAGDLRRTDAAPDGRTCHYSGEDGQEVTLSYLALDGRPAQEALATTEADFRALIPAAATPEPGALPRASGEDDGDGDEDSGARTRPDTASAEAASGQVVAPKPPEPPHVDRGWVAGHGGHEHVSINLPFFHVEADDNGRARVRALGADIDADDQGAVVHAGWNGSRADINATHGGAEMRFGSVGQHRVDLTYVLASDHAGQGGYRAAAYVARGPVGGPLVLAVAKSKDTVDGAHSETVHDLKRLVDRNLR